MIDHPAQDKLVLNWAKLPDRETLLFYLFLFKLNSEHPPPLSPLRLFNITNELLGVINQRL